MKKIAIITDGNQGIVDAIKCYNSDCITDIFDNAEFNSSEYDLVAGINCSENFEGINTHFSLLPSFSGEEPVRQAILAGVKVTGLTVFYTNPFRIIAQYPVFIKNDSHFDDVETELNYLLQTLYPIIINKILNNEQFEIKDILKQSGCSHNCSSCGGCNK